MMRKYLIGAGIGLAVFAASAGMDAVMHRNEPAPRTILYDTFRLDFKASSLPDLLTPDSLLYDPDVLIDSTKQVLPDSLREQTPDSVYSKPSVPDFHETPKAVVQNYRIT